jgi:hypothetical protein
MPNDNIHHQPQTVSSDTLSHNHSHQSLQPSSTQANIWSSFQTKKSRQGTWIINQNSLKSVTQSKPKQFTKNSRQFLIWESLVTVALLMMALWMQTLPLSSTPQRRGVWNRNASPIYPTIR